jgi:hypothetical protein
MNSLEHFSGVARVVHLVVEQKVREEKEKGGQKSKSAMMFYHPVTEDRGPRAKR